MAYWKAKMLLSLVWFESFESLWFQLSLRPLKALRKCWASTNFLIWLLRITTEDSLSPILWVLLSFVFMLWIPVCACHFELITLHVIKSEIIFEAIPLIMAIVESSYVSGVTATFCGSRFLPSFSKTHLSNGLFRIICLPPSYEIA